MLFISVYYYFISQFDQIIQFNDFSRFRFLTNLVFSFKCLFLVLCIYHIIVSATILGFMNFCCTVSDFIIVFSFFYFLLNTFCIFYICTLNLILTVDKTKTSKKANKLLPQKLTSSQYTKHCVLKCPSGKVFYFFFRFVFFSISG